MTVVLHIRRSSGATELHRLRTDGDHVEVPHRLLVGEDVLGFDIELAGPNGFNFEFELAGAEYPRQGHASVAHD